MPDNGDFASGRSARAYRDRLKFWAIVRLMPNCQNVTVARFRSRSDADGHLQLLHQRLPNAQFEVVFDVWEE